MTDDRKPCGVSRTAQGAAAVRALESYRPKEDRLFEDRLARGFVGLGILGLLRSPGIGAGILRMRERQFPGARGGLLCRTRFIDDLVTDALAESFDQVVILGAGADTRAYRVPGIERTRVLEVDHPGTQRWKKVRLMRMLGRLPAHVVFVPIDFDRQELDAAMATADFRDGARTFFIWEGVTQYITAEAVDATFRYISHASAAGSRIVFTYIHRGIIDGSAIFEGVQKLMSKLQRLGEPWIFGLEPTELAQYLAERGLEVVEHVGASDYRERYLNPLGRHMNIFEGERAVLAQVLET